MIIHKQNIEENRNITSKHQQQNFRRLSINHDLNIKEDQILFFNNHHYLHSAPFNVSRINIQGSQQLSSEIVLIRFCLIKN